MRARSLLLMEWDAQSDEQQVETASARANWPVLRCRALSAWIFVFYVRVKQIHVYVFCLIASGISQIGWRLESFTLHNRKYEALKQLSDESFDVGRESPSWKILSSVLYDLAKSISLYCEPLSKDRIKWFVDAVFTQWWIQTPNLSRLDEAGHTLSLGNAHLRLKIYARNRIRSILSSLLRSQREAAAKKSVAPTTLHF